MTKYYELVWRHLADGWEPVVHSGKIVPLDEEEFLTMKSLLKELNDLNYDLENYFSGLELHECSLHLTSDIFADIAHDLKRARKCAKAAERKKSE